jgi:hypothetical protein
MAPMGTVRVLNHTSINHYPIRGGSAIHYRLSCACSGSKDVVKRGLQRLVYIPIEVGVWRINNIPERVHFSSIAIESKFGRRGCSVIEAKGVHDG